MAQTLAAFYLEQQEKMRAFEQWWLMKHTEDPDAYPLTMEDGNEGLWWEMLQAFDPAWLKPSNANVTGLAPAQEELK